MPTRVSYGDKRLIPAGFVSISKSYQTAGDGQKIGSLYQITLNGTIVADKGSPNSSGVFHTVGGYPADEVIDHDSRLGAILRKQSAIRDLFASDGLSFEIQSADGTAPTKCNPRIKDISFPEGLWFNVCPYTITMEADYLYVNGQPVGDSFTYNIASAEENWSFETDEARYGSADFSPTYRLSHTVNAVGKRTFSDGILTQDAWKEARDWVVEKVGYDSALARNENIINLPTYYNAYNHVRSVNTDELGGSYSVSESWVLSSGNAIEDFEVSIQTTANDGISTVAINGTVTGFDERDELLSLEVDRITNAETKWAAVKDLLHTRAESYFGNILNAVPTDTTVGKNPLTGIITYNYSYNDRPSNLITGAKSEVINITDNFDVDVFAAIPVLGRLNGPVLQSINTKKERTKSLSIEVVFDKSVAGSGNAQSRLTDRHPHNLSTQSGDIQSIVNAVKPSNPYQIFVANQQSSWDGVGRYTLNIDWTYEP